MFPSTGPQQRSVEADSATTSHLAPSSSAALPAAEPRWQSINQAAVELSLHTKTIRRMIARGDLYAERIGPRLIRVDMNSFAPKPVV